MPNTLDVEEVVEIIEKNLKGAIYQHHLDIITDVYNVFAEAYGEKTISQFRDYFILKED